MRQIITLAAKDLRILLGDKLGFFFVLIFPLLTATFFGMMYSGDDSDGKRAPLQVLILDEDHTEASRALVRSFETDEAFELTPAESRDSALAEIRAGKATALIAIPVGFDDALAQPFWGDPAELELAVDPTRSAAQGILQGALMERAYRQFQSFFSDPERWTSGIDRTLSDLESPGVGDSDPSARLAVPFLRSLKVFLSGLTAVGGDSAEQGKTTPDSSDSGSDTGGVNWQPVRVKTLSVTRPTRDRPKPSGYAVSFPQGIMWGILSCAAAFGLSLVVERNRGTLTRLRIAPLTRAQILGGKALACFVTTLVVSTVLFVLARFGFGVIPHSIPQLVVGLLSVSICFVGIMMLLSVIGKTEAAAGGIGWSVLLVCSMFGGGMMPLFIMPRWVQDVGSFSPVKWSILVMEGAVWRQFEWSRTLECCGILIAFGVVTFGLGVFVAYRWRRI